MLTFIRRNFKSEKTVVKWGELPTKKSNAYAIIIFLIAVICLCLSSLFLYTGNRSSVIAENGCIDLSGEDFSNKTFALDGSWEFYKDTYCEKFTKIPEYIAVPKPWNNKENKDLHMPSLGKATYRLRVKLPEAGYYMLYVPFISSSYELYANGTCIAKAGTIETAGQKEVDEWKPQNAVFFANSQDLELVLYTSNHICQMGGIVYSIIIGSYDVIFWNTIVQITRSAVFMGILIGFGLYLILLFQKGVNRMCLYLGLFCIGCMLLEGFIGSHINCFLFGGMRYPVMLRFEYVSATVVMLMLVLIYKERYTKQQFNKILYLLLAVNIGILILLLIPIKASMRIMGRVQYIVLAFNIVYVLIVVLRAMRAKEKYAVLSMTGLFVMITGVGIDALNVIKIPYAFSKSGIYVIGIIFFNIIQMYILSQETLDIYEKSVKVRDMEIAYLQAQITPHFFFNTLNNVYTMMGENVADARKLLFEFCSFLRAKFKFDYRQKVSCSLKQEIDLITSFVEIENARFNNLIHLETKIENEFLEIQIPQLLLQPLIENSIKHGFDNKDLTICISCEKLEHMLQVTIHDDGRGMGRGYVKSILTEKSESNGVGLRNIAYRLQKCYQTSMEIHSKMGVGTDIIISIPLQKLI